MKVNLKLIALCIFVLPCPRIFSQSIGLQVTESGKASITVNGELMKMEDITTLIIPAGTGIRFDFSNVKDKTAIFRLIGARQDDRTEIVLDSNYFKVTKTLFSDNRLTVNVNGKDVNINRPFIVEIGSVRSVTVAKATIVPQPGAAIPTTVPQPGIPGPAFSMSGSPSGEAEEPPYKPGSIVYDALKLADNEHLSAEEFMRIIKHYFPDSTVDNADAAETVASSNPFLRGKWIDFDPRKPSREGVTQSGGSLLSALSFSSIGGLDVTNIADGLARFLVKRTKQELSISFFKKFKDVLEKHAELKVLFPETVHQLEAIDEEIYNYERYVQNLREAFKKDITTLHRNLPGIIPINQAYFDAHPVAKTVLLSGCYVAVELENQTHPGDILANYPIEYLDSIRNITVKGAIQTIQLVSASLRDTTSREGGNYWVNISKIRETVNNRRAFKIYMGLLYQEAINRYERVQFDQNNLVAILDQVAANFDNAFAVYDMYKRYILRFGDKVDALNTMIKEYSKPATDSAALENYAKYFRSSVDLIEYCTEASKLPIINTTVPDLEKRLRRYFDIAYEITDLATDVNRRNYSSAINHAVTTYNLIRVKPAEENPAATPDSLRASLVKSSKANLTTLAKYGSFMAAVSTAKNSREVAEAIETAALPVGSSRIKRETPFNVAMNAYVGPYIGYEKIEGVDSSGKLNAFGITAPVGISLSKGRSILFFHSKTHSSSTIFVSLIDIGAVTAFRFTDDSAEKVPSIELKDIFSPGIFLSHGFGKTPLSLNVGFQAGPLLRKVNLDENSYEKNYTRFSVSLCVDIPIFNFHTWVR